MTVQDRDMTVREATIHALEQSLEEFKKLKDSIKKASGSFDAGSDLDGLVVIRDEIIPQISSFNVFCLTLLDKFGDVLEGDIGEEFKCKVETLDALFVTLSKETESGNFTEVGDLLRFDLTDLLTAFWGMFPKMIELFKSSTREDLDLK